jgi:hypothetical protein
MDDEGDGLQPVRCRIKNLSGFSRRGSAKWLKSIPSGAKALFYFGL